MEKKKAIVCTILFAIVLIAIMICSFFIKTEDGMFRLCYAFGYTALGWCISDCIEKFYKWLTK